LPAKAREFDDLENPICGRSNCCCMTINPKITGGLGSHLHSEAQKAREETLITESQNDSDTSESQ